MLTSIMRSNMTGLKMSLAGVLIQCARAADTNLRNHLRTLTRPSATSMLHVSKSDIKMYKTLTNNEGVIQNPTFKTFERIIEIPVSIPKEEITPTLYETLRNYGFAEFDDSYPKGGLKYKATNLVNTKRGQWSFCVTQDEVGAIDCTKGSNVKLEDYYYTYLWSLDGVVPKDDEPLMKSLKYTDKLNIVNRLARKGYYVSTSVRNKYGVFEKFYPRDEEHGVVTCAFAKKDPDQVRSIDVLKDDWNRDVTKKDYLVELSAKKGHAELKAAFEAGLALPNSTKNDWTRAGRWWFANKWHHNEKTVAKAGDRVRKMSAIRKAKESVEGAFREMLAQRKAAAKREQKSSSKASQI